jgi:hypothetical protein
MKPLHTSNENSTNSGSISNTRPSSFFITDVVTILRDSPTRLADGIIAFDLALVVFPTGRTKPVVILEFVEAVLVVDVVVRVVLGGRVDAGRAAS